jgi:hypothetical protein
MTYHARQEWTFQDVRGAQYSVQLTFTDEMLNEAYKVIDLHDLTKVDDFIASLHRKSDELAWGFKPTLELMAARLYRVLSSHYPQLSKVIVKDHELEAEYCR